MVAARRQQNHTAGKSFTLIRERRCKSLPGSRSVGQIVIVANSAKRLSWPSRNGRAVLLQQDSLLSLQKGFSCEADGAERSAETPRETRYCFTRWRAIAKGQVVFRGATLVAVAFDGCFDRRVAFQEVRGLGKSGAGIGRMSALSSRNRHRALLSERVRRPSPLARREGASREVAVRWRAPDRG